MLYSGNFYLQVIHTCKKQESSHAEVRPHSVLGWSSQIFSVFQIVLILLSKLLLWGGSYQGKQGRLMSLYLINKFLFKKSSHLFTVSSLKKGNTILDQFQHSWNHSLSKTKSQRWLINCKSHIKGRKAQVFVQDPSLGLRSASTYSTEISWYSLGCL